MEEQRATRSVDILVAELARAQHGVVGRAQLLELGLTAKAVDSRLERGRLHPLHRGVYAVGHAVVGVDGQRLAAVLACGPNAVLSHRTAADAWGLLRTQARSIDITVTSLAQFETTTTPNGIATTTPARTLLDLAEVVPRRGVERAADQAEALRLFDLDDVERVLQAHAHRHGAARLRRLLAAYAIGERFTRSELEERFLALCERHGIPDPRVNARVAGLEVDFHWPGAHLVAELDGHTHHGTREAFERDRERDAHLLLHGIRTLRITRRRLIDEPEAIARLVLALSAGR
jgi:very-short-patch-repair endonuclease